MMKKTTFLFAAGLLSAAMLASPATARGVTQEPGLMGFYYPSTPYLQGGYGVRMSPYPSYYWGPDVYKPDIGVVTLGSGRGFYYGPY